MVIIQKLQSEVHQLKKEKGKDMSRSQHDMHIPSDKDSSNINVLKNIHEVFNYLYIYIYIYIYIYTYWCLLVYISLSNMLIIFADRFMLIIGLGCITLFTIHVISHLSPSL